MFEESLVESTTLLRTRNRWPAVISLTIQAMLALALVSLPMLHPEVLSLRTPSLITFTPPRPTPPPPPVHITANTSSAAAATAAPTPIFNNIRLTPTPSPTAEEAPNFNPTSLPSMNSGNPGSVFGPAIPGTPAVRVGPPSSGTSNNPNAHLTISKGVSAGLLLTPLHPPYPPIAIAARQEGTVVVQAIISKTGHIESAHVLSGPAMLQQAALDAVRNARYRPYLLNGDPTEVDTTFSINFHLGGS